jgi:Lysozyme like domain
MAVYSYGQLEGLWDEAGGPPGEASEAAAIAEAESAGNPDAAYPGKTIAPGTGTTSDATGLWQILGLPAGNFTAAELTDPLENAKMAVAKYEQAGNSFTPWQTFDEGNVNPQSGIAPDYSGIPAGGSPTATTTAATSGPIPGWLENIIPGGGAIDEISGLLNVKNWVDWAERGALMFFGGILIIVGIIRLTSSSGGKSQTTVINQSGTSKKAGVVGAGEGAAEVAAVLCL